jgi:hypothetical protein
LARASFPRPAGRASIATPRAPAKHRRHGKQPGIGGIRGDATQVREPVTPGARFVIAGPDVQYLLAAARGDVAALRVSAG